MSGTEPITDDGPGIRDILERMDGGQPTNLLPDEPAREQPEQPPEPTHRAPPEPAPQEDAEAVAEQLRRSADAATRRARQAEQSAANERHQRQQAQQELYRTRQARDDTEYNSITSSLADREAEAERLKAEVRTAAEAGDHVRIADINLRLGEIGGDLRDLRRGKEAFESQRQQALRAPEPQPEPPPPAGEWTTVGMSREMFLNGDPGRGVQGRTEATKAWLSQHDEFFTDPKVMKKVTAADMLADAEGIQRDSLEYFKFVEEKSGMSAPSRQPPTPPQHRGSSAPPAAPPSREAPGPTGRNSSDIYVTPEQRRAAEWMLKGMPGGYTAKDAQEYAIEQAELKRSGQYPLRRR